MFDTSLTRVLKSRNILLKLLVSYLGTSVLAVIVITSLLAYRMKTESVKDIHTTTDMALSNISVLASGMFDTGNRLSLEIYNNTNVRNLMFSARKDNLDKLYTAQFINTLTVSYPFIYSVNVCDDQAVVFSTVQNERFDEDYSQLARLLGSSRLLTPIPRRLSSKTGETLDVYSIVYHAGSSRDKSADAFVVININASGLYKQVFSGIQDPSQDVFVVDTAGNILLHNDMTRFAQQISQDAYFRKILSAGDLSGNFEARQGSRSLFYNYHLDAQHKYAVISSSAYNAMFRRVTDFQNSIILTCVLILLAVAGIAILISYKLFTPINNVFLNVRTLFRNSAYTEKQMTQAEFISQAFSGLVARLNNLENENANSLSRQRHEYLVSLLTSGAPYADDAAGETLRKLGLWDDTFAGYRAVVIRLDNLSRFVGNNTREAIEFQLNAIGDIASDCFRTEAIPCAFVLYPDSVAVLLAYTTRHPAAGDRLPELARLCQDTVSSLLNLETTVGLSTFSQDISRIRNQFHEAWQMTCYRLLHGRNAVYTAGTLTLSEDKNDKTGYYMDAALQAVRTDSRDRFTGSLRSLFSLLKTSSYDRTLKVFFQLAHAVSRIPRELQPAGSHELEYDIEDTYRELKALETYEDLEAWFLNLFRKVSASVDALRNIRTPDFIDNVLAFISENYADTSLSANMMAEKLNITPQYFSKVFNERLGTSFPEYINNVRLEKARELLLSDPKLSSAKICAMVGYNNSTYFTSSFTRKFGLSPGKYKASMKLENF